MTTISDYSKITYSHWQRAIALLDMNAFFASVEQRDFPSLLGQPVAITNGMRGSCIITCSYEARAFGIHTGMRVREALQLCPHLALEMGIDIEDITLAVHPHPALSGTFNFAAEIAEGTITDLYIPRK